MSLSHSEMNELSEKFWVGTSITDLYYGHGPWSFEITPVSASRHHAVLYQLPATFKSPPKPHFNSPVHHWDDDHVRMPYSSKNLLPIEEENGENDGKLRWEIIETSLLQLFESSNQLEAAISLYDQHLTKFMALHNFFENVLDEEESDAFFQSLLPGIIRLALQLPHILPGSLPLLKRGSCKSISLSKLQIASMLANAFLCTWQHNSVCPGVNFGRLFSAHFRPKREQSVAEKLKCICHYFRRVLATEPVGVVTFERKHIPKSYLPRWDKLNNNLGNTCLHVSSTGVIEDGNGFLQVDFANKNVGGGVLAFGCVQEEIRFVICPELIISRLFTEQLDATEALVITGAEQYSKYTGYGDEFLWAGNYQDTTPYDSSCRMRSTIVAIDALHFTKPVEQYKGSCMLRELNKAYTGFHSRFEGQLPAVATGNWGCGAFRGDPKLKFLLQLMACSAARRDMVYYTFSDTQLRDDIYEMYLFLATNQITITKLWKYISQFSHANLNSEYLYSFIQKIHVDRKYKPSIKEIFNFNKKNRRPDVNSSPSTSSSKHTRKERIADGINPNSSLDSEDIMDSSQMYVEIDSNSDIIDSSQPEKIRECSLFSDLNWKGKNKCENSQRTENQEDIIHLINQIDNDGNEPNKLCNSTENLSLLCSIDDFIKSNKEVPQPIVERMVIDDVINYNEETTIVRDAVDDSNKAVLDLGASVQKRKITDYFTKIEKG